MKISRYVHRCIDQRGDDHEEEVGPDEYKGRTICTACGERLVTGRALLAHIYKELANVDC